MAGTPSHTRAVFSAEEAQLTEHLDEGIGLVVAGRAVEGELGPAAS
jgi:hypothetical protein